jgi:hypothetical protein
VALEALVAGADLLAVDPGLVGAREIPDVDSDRFFEEVALVLLEEAVVDLDPAAIPGDAVRAGGFGGLPRARDLDRPPFSSLGRPEQDEREDEALEHQEALLG